MLSIDIVSYESIISVLCCCCDTLGLALGRACGLQKYLSQLFPTRDGLLEYVEKITSGASG